MSELSKEARELRAKTEQAARDEFGFRAGDGGSSLVAPPGKFEGEPFYIVHFCARTFDGDGDALYFGGDTVVCDILDVDATEREAFELGASIDAIALWYSDTGHVSLNALSAEEVGALIERDAAADDEEEG